MRLLARSLVLIEAVVCFGPLLFLLLLGIFFAPMWIANLKSEPTADASRWSSIYPLLLVLLGSVGAVALLCVLTEIIGGRRWLNARIRNGLAAPGLVAVFMLNWWWIPTIFDGDMTPEAIWPLLMYLFLPLASFAHLTWLASRMSAAKTLE